MRSDNVLCYKLISLTLYGGPAAAVRYCHLNNIHFYYYYYYYYNAPFLALNPGQVSSVFDSLRDLVLSVYSVQHDRKFHWLSTRDIRQAHRV